jgi:O-antigen/teichoic acid export membrane protein
MAGATQKYMAEHLNRGNGGIARAIFFATLKLQGLVAIAVTLSGLVLVFVVSDPAYRGISVWVVLSMLPAIMVSIPAQANVAAERFRANVGASLAGYAVNIAAVALSLTLGWGLLGVAAGVFAYRCVDSSIKTWSALRWINKLPQEELPVAVRKKLVNFSSYNLALLLLNMIVWDRSDVVFLKALCPDMAQMSFYTVAFNLTEKIQMIPTAVGGAIGASIKAQYGRDATRLPQMTSVATWYFFLFGLPLMTGLAVLSSSVIPMLYGHRYLPAIPVLAVAALFAIPRCYMPSWDLLQALEKQRFLTFWMVVCSAVNVALDIWLIPKHGALGAAFANGLAQLAAAAGIILRARSLCNVPLRIANYARAAFCAAIMAGVVGLLSVIWRGWWFLPLNVAAGAVVFLLTLRLASVFDIDDQSRLLSLRSFVPSALRGLYERAIAFLVPAKARPAIS